MIDFTPPENAEAFKAAASTLICLLVWWGLFIKADWVGENSAFFMSGAKGPVNPTPGCLLKPFGILSLLAALASAWRFVTLVWES